MDSRLDRNQQQRILVFRSPLPHQRRDVDKLERIQKAAVTMVSLLEDTKSKEWLRGAGLFHLRKRRLEGDGKSTVC